MASSLGTNPFEELRSPGDDDRLPWKGFSGSAGFTYDLTGDNLTILKGNFARYQQRLLGWHFNFGVPSGSAAFTCAAMLLNVASGKLSTPTLVSQDGRTLSQALQEVSDLIVRRLISQSSSLRT